MFISLGISPGADAFVMQPFEPDDPPWGGYVYTGSIAELDSRGHAEAIRIIGCLALCSMKAYFPVINVFSESLIPAISFVPLDFDPARDRSGSKRGLHLRIHAIDRDCSLVIRRFNNDDAVGGDTPVLLEPLMIAGPEAVADFVGMTLLVGLAAMHPEVFASFPELSRSEG
jgi:hypothetical protein